MGTPGLTSILNSLQRRPVSMPDLSVSTPSSQSQGQSQDQTDPQGMVKPEFDVRTGAHIGGGEGDAPNSLLKDMGADPGTGESKAPTVSTLSSTPSGTPGAPPSNHGADESTLPTRLPQIQMPDIESLPGTQRIHDLQDELSAHQHPAPLSGWQKFAKYALELGPTVAGAAFGGVRGAGAAAGGTVQGLDTQYHRNQDQENTLLKEIEDEQRSRGQQYEATAHGNLANAQMQTNAILRDAMMKNQAGIAQGHDQTRKDVTQTATDSRESIASAALDHKKVVDQAGIELKDAQAKLAQARAAGIPEQIAIAQRRADSAQAFADAATRRAQVAEDSNEANLFGTQGGKPLPGAPTDEQGHVVGFKSNTATGPTGTTRTKVQQGNAIQTAHDDLVSYIQDHKNQLGPIMGRVNSLEKLMGTSDPASQELRGKFESWIALHPAFHGFRGTNALNHFDETVGGYKQTPESFLAAINGMTEGVGSAQRGLKQTSGYKGPGQATPRGVNTQPPTPATEFERGPDGRIRPRGGR